MSDTNRVSILYVKETSYGVPPATPAMQFLRFTGEGIKTAKETVTSDEIRADRQTPDIIETGQSVEGDINGEVSMETYEDFFLASIQAAALSAEVDIMTSGTVGVVALAGVFTHSAGWDDTPTAGQWIRISGMTNEGNNGYFKVSASPAPTSTTFAVENTGSLTDESGASATILQGGQALNGVQEDSFSIERRHGDLSSIFEQYYGVEFEGFTLDIPADGKVSVTFQTMGKKEEATSATIADSTVDANEYRVISTANNLKRALLGYESICLMSGSVELANNLRQVRCGGELTPNQLGVGSLNVNGSLEVLFSDHIQKDLFLANSETSLSLVFEDAGGRGMVIELPAIVYTDEASNAESKDAELMEPITYETKMDSDEDCMIRYATFTDGSGGGGGS